jgi:two-component system, LytTR family, sensor kinase
MTPQRRGSTKPLTYIVWPLLGLVFGGQFYLFTLQSGYKVSWIKVLAWEVPRWSLWAFMVPFIVSLARRLPIRSQNRTRPILTHAVVSVLFSLLHLLLLTIFVMLITKWTGAVSPELTGGLAKNLIPEGWRIYRMAFTLDFHIGVLVYWSILVVYQALDSSRRAAQLKTQLATAQLDALKMQLHPHFLFNTLNSITALLHQDVEAADEMIGELGNFLRMTLKNQGGNEVELQEELKFLNSYLQIQKVRFQDKLGVTFSVQPETLDARVPNLILQPIVENSIRYGISPRKDPGQIEVRAWKDNGRLHIQILDDGPGISGNGNENPKEGIGLSNVRSRLEQLYGADYVFQLSNRAQGGLSVKLEIAFRTEPALSLDAEDSA